MIGLGGKKGFRPEDLVAVSFAWNTCVQQASGEDGPHNGVGTKGDTADK